MTYRAGRWKPSNRRIGFQRPAYEVEMFKILTTRVRVGLKDGSTNTQRAACQIHKPPGIGKCGGSEAKVDWPHTGVHGTARDVQRSARVGGVHRDAQVGGHGRSAYETAARPDGELSDTGVPGKNQPIARVVVERTATAYIDNGCATASGPDCVEPTRIECAPRDIEVAVAAVLGHPLGVLSIRPESACAATGLIHDRDAAGDVRPGEIFVVINAAADVDDGVAYGSAVGQVGRSGEAGKRAGDVQRSAADRRIAVVGICPGKSQSAQAGLSQCAGGDGARRAGEGEGRCRIRHVDRAGGGGVDREGAVADNRSACVCQGAAAEYEICRRVGGLADAACAAAVGECGHLEGAGTDGGDASVAVYGRTERRGTGSGLGEVAISRYVADDALRHGVGERQRAAGSV